ncbi:MAG TPA: hypothetical protein VGL69_24595 [Solirubrobacteraceae bacterium]
MRRPAGGVCEIVAGMRLCNDPAAMVDWSAGSDEATTGPEIEPVREGELLKLPAEDAGADVVHLLRPTAAAG